MSVDCFGMQSIYITRIAVNGLAERDDRLRPGDKLIQVSMHYTLAVNTNGTTENQMCVAG